MRTAFLKINKQTFFIFFFIIFQFSSVGYTNRNIKSTCQFSKIVAKSAIHFQNYSKLFFEIDRPISTQFFVEGKNDSFSKKLIILDNKTTIDVPSRKEYLITCYNECGNKVIIGEVNTFQDQYQTVGIELSNRLYKSIVEVEKMDNQIPLVSFLKNQSRISDFEKVSFLQQYIMKNSPLDNQISISEFLNQFEVEDFLELEGGDCNCMFVFKTSELITPGFQINGEIIPYQESDIINYNEGSKWWYKRNSEGAAKFHSLSSTGFKSGSSFRSEYYGEYEGGEAPGTIHMAELSYNFLCTDGFVTECRCVKRVQLNYRYDSKVQSWAQKKNALLNKKALAVAQDAVVVGLRVGEDIKFLDGFDIVAQSKCNFGNSNSPYMLDFFNIEEGSEILPMARTLTPFYKLIHGVSTPLAELEQNIINGLLNLNIEQKFEPAGCSEGSFGENDGNLQTKTIDGETEIDLPANTEATLNIFSFTAQWVIGKRSWISEAIVSSNFYLSGVTSGDRIEGGDELCCTNKIGNWIFASPQGPFDDKFLSEELGIIYTLNGEWNLNTQGNIYLIPAEYGRTEIDMDECKEIPPLPLTPIETASLLNNKDIVGLENTQFNSKSDKKEKEEYYPNKPFFKDNNEVKQIIVFDITGRIIFKGNQISKEIRLEEFLKQNQFVNQTGIYFVRFSFENYHEIYKIFIQK